MWFYQYYHWCFSTLGPRAICNFCLKLISNSDLAKSRLPITSVSFDQSFLHFAPNMAVFGQLWTKSWVNEILSIFEYEIRFGRLTHIAQGSRTLEWRHNGRDGVSNHQPRDCLLNRLFKAQIKQHQSSASLAFVRRIHRWLPRTNGQ